MKKTPLYENVIDQIRTLVLEKNYFSGYKLPSERELSKMFGVGRAAVREALSFLAMIGALEVRYSEGIFIKNIHHIDLMHRARKLIQFVESDDKEAIKQALLLMELLESEIIVAVAQKRTKENISELKSILKTMEAKLFDVDKFSQSYLDFHLALAAINSNKVYELVIDALLISISDFIKKIATNSILLGNQACYSYLYNPNFKIYKSLDASDPEKQKSAVKEHYQVLTSCMDRIYLSSDDIAAGISSTEPEALCVGVITFEEIQLTARKFSGVMRAIEEATQKKCNWFFPSSYTSLIEAQLRGFVHISYYGPRSYLLAHDLSGGVIEAFACALWGSGPYRKKIKGYQSYLIVKADSAYETIHDLKGKNLALTDPASTAGDLIPKAQLGEHLQTKISEYFGKIFYAGGHDAAALRVLEGKADAAVVADVTMDWAVDAKRYGPDELKIIWKSKLIPLNCFAWRKDLSSNLRGKISQALININKTEFGKQYLKAVRSDSIVKSHHKDFDIIRKTLKSISKWE
jgi:phosphonate transport system substrate-binding protein